MLFLTMCVGYIFFIIPINLRDDSDGFTATCTVTKAYTQFDATILMAQVLYRDDHGRWAEEDGLDVMSVVGMYGSSRDIYAQFYDLCKTKYVVGVTKSERQRRRRRAARNEARRLERQQAREAKKAPNSREK
ncbi:hypothetical protein [Rothia mucilaginosa]|uniref:hypothetical protein n=1 Tax=Rothia mucilaginosa TaxID=43675 RepID=UPI0028D26C61|nr:hypothetical protein [Rothia mucilaginosa]